MVKPKIQRRDCARNVARFSVLAIEPSLYGDAVLVRAWGRIAPLSRQRLDLYASAGEAGEALEAWLARKVRRGYAPVVSTVKFQPEHPCRGDLAQPHLSAMQDANRVGGHDIGGDIGCGRAGQRRPYQLTWTIERGTGRQLKRFWSGQPISNCPAESTANSLVNARTSKKRQMRWSPIGAQRVLQVRAAVADGRLKQAKFALAA